MPEFSKPLPIGFAQAEPGFLRQRLLLHQPLGPGIHLGIVFIATMELGYLMPPVGLNLFIASHRFDKQITSIYWATQPFLIVAIIAVAIIAFWPGLSLMLLH